MELDTLGATIAPTLLTNSVAALAVQWPTPAAVTYASTLTLDVSTTVDFEIGELTGNVSIAFSNATAGAKGVITCRQDATGGRLVMFAPTWAYRMVNPEVPDAADITSRGITQYRYEFRMVGRLHCVVTPVPIAGATGWNGVACSADGSLVAACAGYDSAIYTSADGGVTWIARASPPRRNITMSADGMKLLGGVFGGYVRMSTDGGVTWADCTAAGSRLWHNIALSTDGSTAIAVDYTPGYIYTSADGGVTWTARTGPGAKGWLSCAASADGLQLMAAAASEYIYTSPDRGVTWTQRTAAGARNWYSCACSASGVLRYAGDRGGYVYTSADSGATWVARTGAGIRQWYWFACSTDGTRAIAATSIGYIMTTVDSGVTWTERTSIGWSSWRYVACSADGTKLFASSFTGFMCCSVDSGANWTEV